MELVLVGILGAALVAWLGWRVSAPKPSQQSPRPLTVAGIPTTDHRYVGSETCRECHPGEHALYSGSGHAHTLRRSGRIGAADRIAGRTFDDPDQEGVAWAYRREGDRLVADRREADRIASFVLDFALGAGKHAITFVAVVDGESDRPEGVEHRLTYFSRDGRMGLTPGQGAGTPEADRVPLGAKLPPAVLLDCIECHATPTARPNGWLDPSILIPNVTCERCHGPGRGHVEAARDGRDDLLAMPFGPGRASGPDQVRLCGRCHRLPEMVPPRTVRVDNPALARFPSVGLVQSACFQGSQGALTCTTCHDPHARTSTDPARYEAACLSCHAPDQGTPCPVNPRDDCLSCHMPKRDVGHGMLFSDHWIRADRQPTLPER